MHLREFFTTNEVGETKLSGLRIEKLAKARRHHFSQSMIDKYESSGLITKSDTAIVVHTVDGDMVFNIDHPPGRYCLHCGDALPNENFEKDGETIPQGNIKHGAGARKHVAEKHKGKKSPDPSIPAGYKMKNYYGTTPDDSVPTVNPKARKSLLASVQLGT